MSIRRLQLFTLLTSGGTLVCCAIPALLVMLGAGAALATLMRWVPQLSWLSDYKVEIYVAALVMLSLGGYAQWRARTAPCPVDPNLRDLCLRQRRQSAWIYLVSLGLTLVGGVVTWVLPSLLL
ncbi:MAG: hypothetical protein RLY30_1651 [Pseudomonadota bacterium]|jgi:hypothetical protein